MNFLLGTHMLSFRARKLFSKTSCSRELTEDTKLGNLSKMLWRHSFRSVYNFLLYVKMHLISGLGYRICKLKYFKKMARKCVFLPKKTFFHSFRAWVSADSAGFRCESLLCFANIISRILKPCSKKHKSAPRNCFVSYDNSFFIEFAWAQTFLS